MLPQYLKTIQEEMPQRPTVSHRHEGIIVLVSQAFLSMREVAVKANCNKVLLNLFI